jgi:hypothetical protein
MSSEAEQAPRPEPPLANDCSEAVGRRVPSPLLQTLGERSLPERLAPARA